MKSTYQIHSFIPTGTMIAGFPEEQIGPRQYIAERWFIDGSRIIYGPFCTDRRKAKRIVNRARKGRPVEVVYHDASSVQPF